MARQGSTLCKRQMSLSVNTELHSSLSDPDPNTHPLSPDLCPPTLCQSNTPFMLQHVQIKNDTWRVTFTVRLLFLTLLDKVLQKIQAVLVKSWLQSG